MTAPRLDDFYDAAPFEVLLVGGLHAGSRMLVRDLPPFLVMPGEPPDPVLSILRPAAPPEPVMPETVVYRFTGSIRDDGTRVYKAER